jgi:hypothetical protein
MPVPTPTPEIVDTPNSRPRPPRQPSRASKATEPAPATEQPAKAPAKKAAKKAAPKAAKKATPNPAPPPPSNEPSPTAKKAAKKAPAKRAPRAKKAQPMTVDRPPTAPDRSPSRRREPATPGIQLLRTLRAKPGFAPELLALAAVDHLGGEARWQTAWLRATYPDASAERLSRLATARFVRQAGYRGAAAALGGPAAMLMESATLAWLQARLVLHLAAAYGHDPLDPARAAELLVLQRIHPTLEVARAALAESARPTHEVPESEPSPARLAVQLGRLAGNGMARATVARLASRLLPGGAILIGALSGARSTEQLALRANRYYRSSR